MQISVHTHSRDRVVLSVIRLGLKSLSVLEIICHLAMIIAHTPADVNQLRGEIKSSRKTDERGGEYYEDEDMQSKKKFH